jgi:hypothetical protein
VQTNFATIFEVFFSYLEAPRSGVGLGRGDRFDLAALTFCPAAVAGWAFSGYFFVLGQTRRHGCDFNVAVASFTFSALS